MNVNAIPNIRTLFFAFTAGFAGGEMRASVQQRVYGEPNTQITVIIPRPVVVVTRFPIFLFAGEGVGGVPVGTALVCPSLPKGKVLYVLHGSTILVGNP